MRTTYADGQAAAVYGQYPPLVNAARPPGQWQSYDVISRARVDLAQVTLARMTVLHNGVLVNNVSQGRHGGEPCGLPIT